MMEFTGCSEDDEADVDCESDSVSVTESFLQNVDRYSLEEINIFLDDTFGKSIQVKDYFPDVGKFNKSVTTLQKVVGLDLLDDRKRYHF